MLCSVILQQEGAVQVPAGRLVIINGAPHTGTRVNVLHIAHNLKVS